MTSADYVRGVLSDRRWYSTSQLIVLLSSNIKPEIAWRAANATTRKYALCHGYSTVVRKTLQYLLGKGEIVRKSVDGHAEWKIK